jgi:hypothetical protein
MSIENPEVFEPQMYTVAEIAKRWRCDVEKVTKIVSSIPGVLDLGSKPDVRKRKRGYRILRVPAAILKQIESKLSLKK